MSNSIYMAMEATFARCIQVKVFSNLSLKGCEMSPSTLQGFSQIVYKFL